MVFVRRVGLPAAPEAGLAKVAEETLVESDHLTLTAASGHPETPGPKKHKLHRTAWPSSPARTGADGQREQGRPQS